jgi:GAF domain-containing protein
VLLQRFVAAEQAHGEWIGTTQTVNPNPEYYRSVLDNEYVKPQGQLHHCGAALGGLDGGVEGGLSINRTIQEGSFSADEVALLAMLTPHLKRALNMPRALSRERSQHSVMRETLEMLDLALLSLDGRGRALRTTAAARSILETRDGIHLDRGFLRAGVPAEQARSPAFDDGRTLD